MPLANHGTIIIKEIEIMQTTFLIFESFLDPHSLIHQTKDTIQAIDEKKTALNLKLTAVLSIAVIIKTLKATLLTSDRLYNFISSEYNIDDAKKMITAVKVSGVKLEM